MDQEGGGEQWHFISLFWEIKHRQFSNYSRDWVFVGSIEESVISVGRVDKTTDEGSSSTQVPLSK